MEPVRVIGRTTQVANIKTHRERRSEMIAAQKKFEADEYRTEVATDDYVKKAAKLREIAAVSGQSNVLIDRSTSTTVKSADLIEVATTQTIMKSAESRASP